MDRITRTYVATSREFEGGEGRSRWLTLVRSTPSSLFGAVCEGAFVRGLGTVSGVLEVPVVGVLESEVAALAVMEPFPTSPVDEVAVGR